MPPLTISWHCVQLDAGVVKFGEKVPFPTPIHGSADMSRGTHFLLWDSELFHLIPQYEVQWRDWTSEFERLANIPMMPCAVIAYQTTGTRTVRNLVMNSML